MQISWDFGCLLPFYVKEKDIFTSNIISEVLIYLMAISEMKTLLWLQNYLVYIRDQIQQDEVYV